MNYQIILYNIPKDWFFDYYRNSTRYLNIYELRYYYIIATFLIKIYCVRWATIKNYSNKIFVINSDNFDVIYNFDNVYNGLMLLFLIIIFAYII